ncbi:MAG: ATP-dependent DNA ligase [Candidatus Aenigmarchaeota archaeon]|nr:ATP-dependent DNA ligase [Candidatus Aenigmarchaeota archaeon]
MDYSILVEAYEKLEKTSAKLKKADIIATLIKKTPYDSLDKTVLLLNGKVFPVWSEREIGVANQLMIRAIMRSFGSKKQEVINLFNKKGDLGIVSEQLAKKKKQTTLGVKKLTLEKVFDNIRKIAMQEGKSSQERKLNLIAELLIHAKPNETKYIIRTILEELRIGVAKGIIRDAISKAFNIDKKIVENAWFLYPDYGKIAQIAKKDGEKGLKSVKIKLGRPIIVMLAEKAPSLEEALKSAGECGLEYKYDGMRTMIHKDKEKIWIFTRSLEDVTSAFPDLVKLAKKNIKCEKCIIEGETLAIHPKTRKPQPFQVLSQRIKRKYNIQEMIRKIPIQFNAFDIIYLNGKTLFDKMQLKRRQILEKQIKEQKGIFQLSKMIITNNLEKAKKFYNEALRAGQEGIMVKRLNAKYQPERHVGYWWKVKPTMENLDLVIIGATWGTGKRTGVLGSYILGCRDAKTGDFLECGMLGSGFKEKKTEEGDVTLKDMTKMLKPYIEYTKGNKVKIKPKIVIEVAYEEIQRSPTYKSGYALRFPRFIRLRSPEKSAEEADTLGRIKYLYSIQKGKKK